MSILFDFIRQSLVQWGGLYASNRNLTDDEKPDAGFFKFMHRMVQKVKPMPPMVSSLMFENKRKTMHPCPSLMDQNLETPAQRYIEEVKKKKFGTIPAQKT